MNLRIKDGPKLVAFLHGIVSGSGTPILSTDGFHVVEIGDLVFYHRSDPLTVGGPFRSVEHLVCSEGVRRFPEPGHTPAGEPPAEEIVEWASSFFRIEREGHAQVGQYGSLEAAKEG